MNKKLFALLFLMSYLLLHSVGERFLFGVGKALRHHGEDGIVNGFDAKESPFASFMGMKWGITAAEFLDKFEFGKMVFADPDKQNARFVASGMPFGNVIIIKVDFVFTAQDKTLEFEPSNYSRFYFAAVEMNTMPGQFELLLEMFSKQYGKPFSVKGPEIQGRKGEKPDQKEIIWKNGNRRIKLLRYSENDGQLRVMFYAFENEK